MSSTVYGVPPSGDDLGRVRGAYAVQVSARTAVAVVEPDDVVAAIGQVVAQVVGPGEHLRGPPP